MKRFMHMRQQSRNYFLRFPDQWVMVFEAGFRVDFVIVFVIVLCLAQSPTLCPWDTRLLDLFMQC